MNIICVWPDGNWCWRDDVEEFLMPPCSMSDDFMEFDVSGSTEEEIEEFVVMINNGEI